MPVALEDIAVIDNHCHAVEADEYADVTAWRGGFTESPDPRMRAFCPATGSPARSRVWCSRCSAC